MSSETQPDYFLRGVKGRCPRCGEASLFKDLLAYRDTCPACGLEISAHDNGDGPIFFVIVIVGALVTGLAAWVEAMWEPPFWLHALLWTPLVIGLTLWLLRLFKGIMLASEVKHRRLGAPDDD